VPREHRQSATIQKGGNHERHAEGKGGTVEGNTKLKELLHNKGWHQKYERARKNNQGRVRGKKKVSKNWMKRSNGTGNVK